MNEVDVQRKLLKCSMYVKCCMCCGEGLIKENNEEITCPECHGTGKVRKSQPEPHKFKKTLL
jgi:DnaJ-class molecular chaperone